MRILFFKETSKIVGWAVVCNTDFSFEGQIDSAQFIMFNELMETEEDAIDAFSVFANDILWNKRWLKDPDFDVWGYTIAGDEEYSAMSIYKYATDTIYRFSIVPAYRKISN